MTKPIKYNPNKGYSWQPGDTFLISGQDYSTILALTRSILETKEARTIFLAQGVSEALQESLMNSVEKGIAKEIEEPEKNDKKD